MPLLVLLGIAFVATPFVTAYLLALHLSPRICW